MSYPVWAWPLKPSVGMENPADQVTARSFDVWKFAPAASGTQWVALGAALGCSILTPLAQPVERTA